MNSLNTSLHGKHVLLRNRDGVEATMLVDSNGGFGAYSFTSGRGLFGVWTTEGSPDKGKRTGKINAMLVRAVLPPAVV